MKKKQFWNPWKISYKMYKIFFFHFLFRFLLNTKKIRTPPPPPLCSCSQCQSTYIGETQRHLISRICEHKGISPRTSMPFSNPPFSNIREHALSFDHPIKVDNFSVLARCHSHDLRLLESIFIHKFSPNLNNQASSFPLQILSWGITFFYG